MEDVLKSMKEVYLSETNKPTSKLSFNLSKALEGYKVVDELGQEVKVVAKLSCKSSYPVVVICTNMDGECVRQHSTEGVCKTYGTKLFMVGKQEMEFSFVTPVKGMTFSSEKDAKRRLGYEQSAGRLKGAEISVKVVTGLVKN